MTIMPFDQATELQKIADVIDHNPIPSFLMSVEDEKTFRFITLNKAHVQATGMRVEDTAGKTPQDIFPPRLAETITANYSRCVQNRATYEYDEVIALPNGEMWWNTFLTPIFEGDKIIGVLGLAYDKTEDKRTEKLLAESLENANRLNEDLKIVSTTMAHDLRAPLRQLGTIKDLLLADFQDLGDNKLELLERGRSIITGAMAQVNEVLSQAKAKNPTKSNMAEIDFGMWCLDMIALLDPLKKFEFLYPSAKISCEKFIIDIALRNLLDNACKYAKSEVSVDVKQDGQYLYFTVTDDGDGFTNDNLSIGNQSDPAVSSQKESGFGLSNSANLIEARGGKLWIEKPSGNKIGGVVKFKVKGKLLDTSNKFYTIRAA